MDENIINISIIIRISAKTNWQKDDKSNDIFAPQE